MNWGGAAAPQSAVLSWRSRAQRGPIQIEADELTFLDKEGRAVYVGNVDADPLYWHDWANTQL